GQGQIPRLGQRRGKRTRPPLPFSHLPRSNYAFLSRFNGVGRHGTCDKYALPPLRTSPSARTRCPKLVTSTAEPGARPSRPARSPEPAWMALVKPDRGHSHPVRRARGVEARGYPDGWPLVLVTDGSMAHPPGLGGAVTAAQPGARDAGDVQDCHEEASTRCRRNLRVRWDLKAPGGQTTTGPRTTRTTTTRTTTTGPTTRPTTRPAYPARPGRQARPGRLALGPPGRHARAGSAR